MIASIVIGALIFLYAAYIIRKKLRDMKEGKFCSCNCDQCGKCSGSMPENKR